MGLKGQTKVLTQILAIGLLFIGYSGYAQGINKIKSINIQEEKDYSVVVIRTAQNPTFNVFKLENPPRVFVDITGSSIGNVGGFTVENGVISRIGALEFSRSGMAQARIVITLVRDVPYLVTTKGNAILIKFSALHRKGMGMGVLQSKIDRLQSQLNRAKQEASKLRRMVKTSQQLKEAKALLQQIMERKKAIEEAAQREQERLDYLRQAKAALKEQIEAQKKVNQLMQEKAAATSQSVRAKKERQLRELQALIEQKKAERARLQNLAQQVKQEEMALREKAAKQKEAQKRLNEILAKSNKAFKEYIRAQRQVESLKLELARTYEELNRAKKELAETKKQHKILSKKVRVLQGEVVQLQTTKGRIEDLSRRLEKVSEEAKRLKAQLAQTRQMIKKSNNPEQIKKLKEELGRVESQYQSKLQQLKEIAQARAHQIEVLKARLEQERQMRKRNLAEVTAKLQAASLQAAKLRKKLSLMRQRLAKARNPQDVQRLKGQISQLKARYEAKIRELNVLATQKAAQVRRLSNAIERLKKERGLQQEQLNQLRSQLQEREAELKVMKAALKKAQARKGKTEAQKAQVRQLRRQVAEYEARTKEIVRKYKSLLAKEKAARVQRERRIKELVKQMEILKSEMARRSSIEVENLRKAVEEKERQIRQLKAQQGNVEELKAQIRELKKLQKALIQAQKREAQARKREAEAGARIVSLMDKLAKTEGELAVMKEKLRETSQKLETLASENEKSKEKIQRLQQELAKAKTENVEEVKRLQEQLKREQERRQALERKQKMALEELHRTRMLLQKKQQEKQGIEQQYKAQKGYLCTVEGVRFEQADGKGVVKISVKGTPDYRITRLGPKTLLMTIKKAVLKPGQEKKLDVSAFDTPVSMVTVYLDDHGNVKVLVEAKEAIRDSLDELKGLIVWNLMEDTSNGLLAQAGGGGGPTPNQTYKTISPRAPVIQTEQTYLKPYIVPKRRRFRGKRINLTVKDADIINVLTFLAKEGHVNIVTTKDVSGKVSFHLETLPWDQALDIILKVNGLDYVVDQGIYRVAPAQEIQEEYKREIEKRKRERELKPLLIRLIPVNYSEASQLAVKVKSILSKRGSVSVDKRTNTLIVKDTEEHLEAAEQLVKKLDMQTPQVLIEARIVEARTSFTRSLGIQWGGKFVMAPGYGNDTGLIFPNTVGIAGGADDTSSPMNGLFYNTPHFAVNLPAPAGMGTGGAIGLTLGSIGGAANLSLRLSAAEENGDVKIISAPRISTLDNESALIAQGVSIPISVVSAAGVNTQFFSADLRLQVTPHVTRDGHILLKIFITKNEPDFGNLAANGNPTIQRKEAKTQLLVNDGDTAVIGGIYTKSQSESRHKVPLLGDIPILGWFFKNHARKDDRSELLIFITPKVVNREQSL